MCPTALQESFYSTSVAPRQTLPYLICEYNWTDWSPCLSNIWLISFNNILLVFSSFSCRFFFVVVTVMFSFCLHHGCSIWVLLHFNYAVITFYTGIPLKFQCSLSFFTRESQGTPCSPAWIRYFACMSCSLTVFWCLDCCFWNYNCLQVFVFF